MSSRRSKKRVRFSEEDELETAINPNLDRVSAPRLTLLPEPEEELWIPSQPEKEEGPIKSTNPEFAAAVRARHRKEIDSLKVGEALDISLLDDLGGDGEADELRFTEDGIPIEPFNLRAEKAAGFFDAEGNYVAYKGEDDTDAWLETLPAGPLEGREAAGEEAQEEDNVEKRPMMTEAEKLNYRQSIVEKLRSGESVLDALKRLGSPEEGPGSGQQSGASKADRLATMRTRLAGTVPTGNRALFNEITDHAGQLLNAGDATIYSRTREDLAADLRRAEALPGSSAGSTPANFVGKRNGVSEEAMDLLAKLAREGVDAMDDEDMGVADGMAVADPDADIFAEAVAAEDEAAATDQGGGDHRSISEPSPNVQGEVVEPPKELAGFEFDQSSGLYYNTSLGCYFDAQKQLYGDASSGQWYSFEDGAYKLASLSVRT